jgi:hypothetical protein
MLEKPVAWRVGDGQKEVLEHAFLPVKTSKTPMSEDPSKQVQYNVSPGNSVSIRLYDKQNKLLDHVYIGQSSNNNFSYGRREGSNQIFQLKKNIYAQISAQPAAWRAPEIINFRLPDLLKVEVKYTKNTYRLNVKGNGVYYEDSKETFPLNPENRATSKFFMALSNLSTFTFFDNQWQKYAANFAKPAAVITIKTIGQKEIKLTFAEGPDDSVLLMRNDEHETLYGLNYDTLNRFTISAEHFKE